MAHKRHISCHLILRYGDALVLTRHTLVSQAGHFWFAFIIHFSWENSPVVLKLFCRTSNFFFSIFLSSLKADTWRMFIIDSTQFPFLLAIFSLSGAKSVPVWVIVTDYRGSSSLAPRVTGNVILSCLFKMWIDIASEAGVSIFYKNRFFIQYRTEMYLNTNVVLLLLDKLLTKKILYVPNVFMIHCKEKRFRWKCNFLLQLFQWMYVVCSMYFPFGEMMCGSEFVGWDWIPNFISV